MYCYYYKNRSKSYIETPEWIGDERLFEFRGVKENKSERSFLNNLEHHLMLFVIASQSLGKERHVCMPPKHIIIIIDLRA